MSAYASKITAVHIMFMFNRHHLFQHMCHVQPFHSYVSYLQPGCRLHGSCSALFPQQLHDQALPYLDPANRRYRYHRLREEDRLIGPYHPMVLMLWNAHMNIQRITHAAWSLYLLKYAMKVRVGTHQSCKPDKSCLSCHA